MNLCLVGTGYVGLVGAAMFADWGNNVVGVDIDEEKIAQIKKGVMPIYEPGLKEILDRNLENGRLKFTTSLSEGIKDAEIVFICVGTPQDETGAADLSYVWKAAEGIGKHIDGYKVIATKSTVPVGTNEKVKRIIKEVSGGKVDFDVASNPEFLREGSSVEDMLNTDRTVIGSDSERALKVLNKLYDHLNAPIVECDLRSAEMIKYASNAFLATKISFINEIAQLCERAGADVLIVSKGMGLDRRIGTAFLNAGIGFGGSCFPKDVSALYRTSTDQAYDFKLLRGVMEVNERQKSYYIAKITKVLGKNLTGKTIACLGLSFKSNTDDTRESISIKTARILRGYGADLRVYDPQGMENAQEMLGDHKVYYAKDSYDAIKDADALCLLTEWEEFRELDLKKVKKLLKGKYIFDGRNLLDREEAAKLGFVYFCVGRKPANFEEKKHISITALLENGD